MGNAWIGLLGVIIGFALKAGLDTLNAFANRRRNARHLAVRVVCILENFVLRCSDTVDKTGKFGADGHCIIAPSPPLQPYPEELDWKSINTELLYSILSIPTRISLADSFISSIAEYDGPPWDQVADEKQLQFAKLGLFAAEISQKLRKKYDLPRDQDSQWIAEGWDMIGSLKNTVERIQKERDTQSIRSWQMVSKLIPN